MTDSMKNISLIWKIKYYGRNLLNYEDFKKLEIYLILENYLIF